MTKYFRLFFLFACFFVSSQAHAVLSIEICGSASHTCSLPNGSSSGSVVIDMSTVSPLSFGSGGYVSITDSNGSSVDIPVGGAPVPAPYAAPTASIVPGTTSYTDTMTAPTAQCTTTAATGQLACDAAHSCAVAYYGWPNNPVVYNGSCANVSGSGTWGVMTTNSSAPSCPSGYVLVNGVCTLTDARLIVPDSTQDWTRSNNTYGEYSGDLKGVTVGASGTTSTASDSVSVTGQDSAGNTVTITSVAVTGGTVITKKTQLQDSVGSTYVKSQTVNFSSTGSITSTSSQNITGSLSGVAGSDGGLTTIINNGSGVIAAAPASGFPGDYARTGEAATAAAGLGTKLDGIGTKLDGIGTKLAGIASAVSDTSTPTEMVLPVDADMPGWSTTFDNLKGWSLPPHNSACPQPTLDLSNVGLGTHVMDSHCALMINYGAVIHQAMTVVFSVLALFVILAA